MTDSKMPERIWAVDASGTGCIVSFDTPSLDYKHEYIRADLTHPAPVADAELEALETGDKATLLIEAEWKSCVHGGGWWVAKDADDKDVLLPSPPSAPAPPSLLGCSGNRLKAQSTMRIPIS